MTADLDYYIDKAEAEVLTEWIGFDPGLQQKTRTSAATDASGILLVDQGFTRLQRVEDANQVKYPIIDDIDKINTISGYIFAGFDQTNKKRKLQIFRDGVALASTTLYWWELQLVLMGSGASDVSAIPDGYKELIDYQAAKKFFEDQGPSMKKEAQYWGGEYDRLMNKASEQYSHPSKDPEYITSTDPDAGDRGPFIHRVV